jgi:hypothetical protein
VFAGASKRYESEFGKTQAIHGLPRRKIFRPVLSNWCAIASKQMREEVNRMSTKVLIAGGLILAFMVGAMANGIYTATTRAFNPVEDKQLAIGRSSETTPIVSRTHFVQPAPSSVQPRTVYVSNPVPASPSVSRASNKRSTAHEVLIVGGSAGAGAAVGAVAGGKKGAAIGAVSGGVAGLVYDLVTRNK